MGDALQQKHFPYRILKLNSMKDNFFYGNCHGRGSINHTKGKTKDIAQNMQKFH